MLWGAEKLVPAEYWCPYGTWQEPEFGIVKHYGKHLGSLYPDEWFVIMLSVAGLLHDPAPTWKFVRGLSDVATTNVFKVDSKYWKLYHC